MRQWKRRFEAGATAAVATNEDVVPVSALRETQQRIRELERLLDDKPTPELWDGYYRAVDLWLRSRAPVPSTPPITKGMLPERFAQTREGRSTHVSSRDP